MRVYLTKRYSFAASHRLHNDVWPAEKNQRVYGKCNNPHGHGHNYALEVTVSGPIEARTGMVCDLGALDAAVEREVLARFDHEHLNLVPAFAGSVPTSENLTTWIYEILQRNYHAAHLERVRLEETSQNSFEYAGGGNVR
jgi:6-pyruvoyltetrahydropterin/6-carboxytetrahydropterin synthase